MWLPAGLLCLAAVAGAIATENQTLARPRRDTGDKKVVCYYTNWSVYRPGTAKFNPLNINPYLCTHLVYAFGGLTKDNALKPFDKYQDIEQGGYAKFNGLKTYNKDLKTMLAIGGWNEGSARFSPLVADADRRKELVRNVIKFLRQNHFDGLDLDWEYPAFRDGGKARDRDNYATLVQELRDEFNRETEKTGRTRLLLTMAVPAGLEYIDKGYDVAKLNEYLDWFNILSYDYHSAFEPSVDHHAPLFSLEPDDEYNFGSQLNIDATVKHYLKLGAERNKLVLGIPTYGRSYTLFNPDASAIGSPADGPGEQGEATREKGYLAYYEICERVKSEGWTVVSPNADAMGPFAYKDNQWVGYDDEAIAKAKAKYVNDNDLGGIMFWSIDNDDFRGKCHGRPYPIIEAAKEALVGSSNELAPSSQRKTQSSSNSKKSNVEPSLKTKTKKNRPRPKTTSSSTTEATRTIRTTPAYSTTTPQPPTTPDPGSDFVCKDEGFFPHPRDCKKYFWCLDSGPSSLGIVAHQFTCPSGLIFNKISDSCDYARNVICKTKTETTTTSTAAPSTTTTRTTTARGKVVITAAPPRHTTTTTTTTESPEYEEEEEEEGEYEDPGTIKELIGLIKRLGGVEQLEKQLAAQEGNGKDSKATIKSSLYNKVLGTRTAANKLRAGATEDTSTSRYQSLFRNRPVGPQAVPGAEDSKPSKLQEKPQYVTIQRNRVPSRKPVEQEEEESEESSEEEEDEAPPEVTKSNRRKPSGSADREYVQLKRNHNKNNDESTTLKYKSILRTRSTTESPQPDEESEEENVEKDFGRDDQIDVVEKPKKYSSVYRERTRSRIDETEDEDTVGRSKVSGPTRQYVTLDRRTSTPEPVNNVNSSTEDSEGTSGNVNSVNTPKYLEIVESRRKWKATSTTVETDVETESPQMLTEPSNLVTTARPILEYVTPRRRQNPSSSSTEDVEVQASSTENVTPSELPSKVEITSASNEIITDEDEKSNFVQRRIDPTTETITRKTRPPVLTTQPYVEPTAATRGRFRVTATTTAEVPTTEATLRHRSRGRPEVLRRARPTSTVSPSVTTETSKRFHFAPRTKPTILAHTPKSEVFTIVVPETTVESLITLPAIESETVAEIETSTESKGLPTTAFQRTRGTTTREPPTTSTVTRVVTSITESSFTERQKISITKKPTFVKRITKPTTTEKTVTPIHKAPERSTRPYGIRRRVESRPSTTTTTERVTERTRSRFRARSTTPVPEEPTTEERKFVPKRGRARGIRKFNEAETTESTQPTTTITKKPVDFASRKRVLARKIKNPSDDLDSQQSSSFYDDNDDESERKYILGESVKKTSAKDYLSAEVIFATVPTVENEEKSAITERVTTTTTAKPLRGRLASQGRTSRGRIKAVESLTENIPEDYRKKIKKVIQRRRPVSGRVNSQRVTSSRNSLEAPRNFSLPEENEAAEPLPSTTSTSRPTTAHLSRRTSQDYLTNLRARARSTTTPVPSTTASERPQSRRQGVITDRRRKFRPESQRSTTSRTSELESDDPVSSTRSPQFNRRRTRPTTTTTTTTSTTPEPEPILPQEESEDTIDLPDLADPAVVAIHNLAAVAPVHVRESSNSFKSSPFSPSHFSASSPSPFTSSPRFTSTISRETPSTFSRPPSPRLIATSYADFQQEITNSRPTFTTNQYSPSTTPRGITPEAQDTPSTRSEVIIAPRRQQELTTITRPEVTTQRAPSQRKPKPFAKVKKPSSLQNVPKPELFPIKDYEYYDDVDPLADVPPSALKVKVHSDGYIECLDQGNFPHPFSCKKFISCAKMENSELLGWEYTCPKHLSFDPVGGICNWSAGLGCQQ